MNCEAQHFVPQDGVVGEVQIFGKQQ